MFWSALNDDKLISSYLTLQKYFSLFFDDLSHPIRLYLMALLVDLFVSYTYDVVLRIIVDLFSALCVTKVISRKLNILEKLIIG